MDYRHEVKHIISPGDAAAIRANLTAVANPDPHAAENGRYRIRSLYVDDPLDTALRETLDGVTGGNSASDITMTTGPTSCWSAR